MWSKHRHTQRQTDRHVQQLPTQARKLDCYVTHARMCSERQTDSQSRNIFADELTYSAERKVKTIYVIRNEL